jgi:hypothetical protein
VGGIIKTFLRDTGYNEYMATSNPVVLIPANSNDNFSPEKWWYINWLTLPVQCRRPRTQRKVAEYLHIHPVTLTRWKSDPKIRQMVLQLIKQRTVADLPDILRVIYDKAMEGSPAHIKIYLELVLPTLDNSDLHKPNDAEVNIMQSEEAVAARHGKYNPPDLASKWGFEL